MMTAKNSKKDLFAEVERVLKNTPVLDKNWVDRAKYALKAGLDKCTKTDLLGLLKDVAQFTTPAPVENSPKPALKKSGKKSAKAEKPEEEVADVEDTQEAEAEPKKKSGKSLKTPKTKVEQAKEFSKKTLPTAKIFPKTIEVKDLGTLEVRNEEFNSISDIAEALNEGREIYFAGYWTPRHIKEFNYSFNHQVACPKSFENDLDIMMAVITCTNIDRVWCMSAYTEAMFAFDNEALERVEDKDANGDKYEIRVCNGMEFEIYEKISD